MVWEPLWAGGEKFIEWLCKSQQGTSDCLGKFGIPSVLSFIWPLIFTEIINRIMIMSDNVKVLMIFTQKEELN